jgi:CRP-like cAMP-binding protein
VLLHIAEIYHYQQGGCSIHVGIDRQDMADLAGTTKEQVSLVLSTLRQEKLVNFKAKHFKYFDLEGLRKIAAAS